MRGTKPNIVCLGELLWDVLPDGEVLGGAPANVAFHAARLGARARLVSRVGRDARGALAQARLARAGVDVELVSVDPRRPTGHVEVCFDAAQEPHFSIAEGAAWEQLELPALAALRDADVLCLGTLALRDPGLRRAALRLLTALRRLPARARPLVLVDVNLRPPFTDEATCLALLRTADLVKVNEAEAQCIAELSGAASAERWLLAETPTRLLAVTRGAAGARLVGAVVELEASAPPARGGDAIGAGDAFVACLAVELARGSSPPRCLERAVRYASSVAGQRGAMPEAPPPFLRRPQ